MCSVVEVGLVGNAECFVLWRRMRLGARKKPDGSVGELGYSDCVIFYWCTLVLTAR